MTVREFTGKVDCVVRREAPEGDQSSEFSHRGREGGPDWKLCSGGEHLRRGRCREEGWDGSFQAGRMLGEQMLHPNCLFSRTP